MRSEGVSGEGAPGPELATRSKIFLKVKSMGKKILME